MQLYLIAITTILHHIVLCDPIYTNALCFNLLSHELTPKCHRVVAHWYMLIAMLTELRESHFNSLRYYDLTTRIMERLGFMLDMEQYLQELLLHKEHIYL